MPDLWKIAEGGIKMIGWIIFLIIVGIIVWYFKFRKKKEI